MATTEELAEQIAELWARESQLEEKALRLSDPLLRSNMTASVAELTERRQVLHDEISHSQASGVKEALILALFAADFFAQNNAGDIHRDVPLRRLHDSIIDALEEAAGVTREDLGLAFLWSSDHDGPA